MQGDFSARSLRLSFCLSTERKIKYRKEGEKIKNQLIYVE